MTPRRLTAALALSSVLWTAPALARPVRVRGGAQLQAQAQFVETPRDVLELRARLLDDARDPIEGAWLELRASGGLDVLTAEGCTEPRVNVAPLSGGLRVETAGGGELCLRWRDTPARGAMTLKFGGDTYHGGADLSVSFDRDAVQKLATTLRFDPRPLSVDLDEDRVAVAGVLNLALSTAHAPRAGRAITLHDESGKEIARGDTAGDGKVRLSFDPAALGPPGQGQLTLRFAGSDELDAAEDAQPVTRRALARIALGAPVEDADAGDSAELSLDVTTARGAVDGGVVEALIDGQSAGSAPVRLGRAALHVAIDPKAKGRVAVQVRYLPASPFFEPGPALAVAVPIAPPSILLRVLLALVVSATAAWVVVSWRRSKKRPSLLDRRPLLTPGVHVVHSRRGAKAWNGTVVDAHDGQPLAGARIVVRAPSLEGDGVLREIASDARGQFAFDLDERPEGAELIASSDTHAEERKALPAGGTLRIALITRRRALLRRLVQWARIRGRPYDETPDPTPGHVRQTAAAQRRAEVEAWARAVEQASFGPGDVDASVEARIRDIEPGP